MSANQSESGGHGDTENKKDIVWLSDSLNDAVRKGWIILKENEGSLLDKMLSC